jgi:hypothetical protein
MPQKWMSSPDPGESPSNSTRRHLVRNRPELEGLTRKDRGGHHGTAQCDASLGPPESIGLLHDKGSS